MGGWVVRAVLLPPPLHPWWGSPFPLSIKLHLADNGEFYPEVNVNWWGPQGGAGGVCLQLLRGSGPFLCPAVGQDCGPAVLPLPQQLGQQGLVVHLGFGCAGSAWEVSLALFNQNSQV